MARRRATPPLWAASGHRRCGTHPVTACYPAAPQPPVDNHQAHPDRGGASPAGGAEPSKHLEGAVAELRARLAATERRIGAVSASPWWQAREILKEAARKPWKLPRLLALAFRVLRGLIRASPEVRRGEALLGEKRYAEAATAFDDALARDPADVRALRRKREAQSKMGDLTGMLATVQQMRAVADADALARAERMIGGRLRELDPSWLPEVPGPPRALEPGSPGRVLHLLKHSLPYHTNGYTVRSRYTLLAQAGAGLEPAVVTSPGFPRSEGVADVPAVELLDGIPHHRLDLGADYPYEQLPPDEQLDIFAWLAAGVVRDHRPAVIHARSGFRGYEIPLVGLALSRHFRIPMVYEISSFLESTWTADVEWSERGELYRLRVSQENRAMREAAHVITIAESMRADIIDRGIDPERVTVIPNAVDAEAFAPRPKDAALAASLGLDGKVVLGYISNLGYREGLDILIEAVARLVRAGRPVACLIAGDGPERPKLEALVGALGIGDRVRLVGSIPHEQIKDYYALIDVFIVPRRDDRAARLVTPLKPYEAMAMGRPLVVASLPALAEIVGDGARGLVFDHGSAESLAAVVEPLVADESLRAKVGELGREWVVRERTWEANGRRYRELYEQARERFLAGAPVVTPTPSAPVVSEGDEVLEAAAIALREQLAEREDLYRRIAEGRWARVARAVRRELGNGARLPGLAVRGARYLASSRGTVRGSGAPAPGKVASHAMASGPKAASPIRQDNASFLERGMEALKLLSTRDEQGALADTPEVHPALLGYWPVVVNNPYQSMIYAPCWDHAIAPIPVTDLAALDDTPALAGLGADVWLHVHWTAPVLQRAGSDREARALLASFEQRLETFKGAGGRIAWTVHNVLPHERRYEELEAAVCRSLAERADLIHVLCARTPELTEPHYTLPPEKVRVIPHPSYLGIYPAHLSRAQARFELGLGAGDTVLAVVGGIRRYKGIDALLEAFDEVRQGDASLKLIVAGRPIAFPGLEAMRGRLERDPAIVAKLDRIPDEDLQLYLGAADVVVLPYADILNSGVLMLGLSFGRPVIAPDRGCVADLVSDEIGFRFDPASPRALADAIARAPDLKAERYQQAARRVAEELAPARAAAQFAEALRDAVT